MPQPDREQVAIVIGDDFDSETGRRGSYFGYWSNVEIRRSIDTFSTVTFEAPFEPERKEFRATFRPFTFPRLETLINLETIVTGFILDVSPELDANARKIRVTGYAKPAVLHDCNFPPDAFGKGLQFQKQSLLEIAKRIGDPFGIACDFRDVDPTPFAKVKLDIDRKLFEFLVDLAKQRSRVLTDTPSGDLLCWQSVEPGNPVCFFVEGRQPLTKVSAEFSPREYYSEITGFGKKKRANAEARWTALNHFLETPRRPHTFKLEDSERADVPTATLANLGKMFANILTVQIDDLPGWRDPQGNLWQPNTTLKLTAPGVMVYRETEFLIRDVVLKQTPDTETASLSLVLPGAFSGRLPDDLPWDETE
jgi:prophage tail gpP-like protein